MRVLFFAAVAVFGFSIPSLPAADDVRTELKSLVETVNAKLNSGATSELALAQELKEFDAILARHSDDKSDAAAEVLFMKAMLYIEVLNDPAKGAEIFKDLEARFPGTKAAIAAAEAMRSLKRQEDALRIEASLKVGTPFPNFDEKDLDGAEMSVSALKGKVVLVDFWATWCPPCVAELPYVLAAYGKYHDKGFDILGISLDEDKGSLVRFIKRTKMPWPQYFDGLKFDNKLAVKYGVLGIPTTYLLGKDGTILAKNPAGEELDAAIAEALNAD